MSKFRLIANIVLYLVLTSSIIYLWINEKKIGKKIKEYRKKTSEYIIKKLHIKSSGIQNFIRKFVNITETLGTALILVLIIQYFYIGNFMVPTGSMLPTIKLRERFFGDMVSYRFRLPKRGEILVFKEPIRNQDLYTKRLVGLPGEKITINENGKIEINEKIIDGSKWENIAYGDLIYKINRNNIETEVFGEKLIYKRLGKLFGINNATMYSYLDDAKYLDFDKKIFLDRKVFINGKEIEVSFEGDTLSIYMPYLGETIYFEKKDLDPVLFVNGVEMKGYARKDTYIPKDISSILTDKLESESGKNILQLDKSGNLYLNGTKVMKVKRRYTKVGTLSDDTWRIPRKGDILVIEKGGDSKLKYGEDEEINIDEIQKMMGQNPESLTYLIPQLKFTVNGETTGPILDLMQRDDVLQKLKKNNKAEIKLENNYYMVLGDNTSNSFDSRYWGFVNERRIRGRTIFRFWPLSEMGWVK